MIWIDGDACPRQLKELVFKTAIRLKIKTVVVANRGQKVPNSVWISLRVVANKLDEADRFIVDNITAGDVVITADIPFAAQVVDKASFAINPRGELYTAQNISERLSIRNFMDDLRGAGVQTGMSGSYNDKDKKAFAATFDRIIQKIHREQKAKAED